MIPKIIHYCWFGGKELPKDVKKCIKSWKKKCPDYEIKRWDESNFDINSNCFIKDAYMRKAWAFVSDYARLKIIYDYGGIYLDTDVELIKNLDEVLKYKAFFAQQQSGEINTGLGFGAEKKSSIVNKMLVDYETMKFDYENKECIACPILNTKAIKQEGFFISDELEIRDNIIILPAKYMDPFSSGEKVENLLCQETLSIHHYSATWTSGNQRLKRKIARMLGEDKILAIKKIIRKV